MNPARKSTFLACVWTLVGMVLSETQAFGFADKVRELLTKARKALEAAGWNVDMVLARIDALRTRAWTANEEQEIAKRMQKAKTSEFLAAKAELYEGTSGYLDMAIAAVGKNSENGKDMRKYRSRIRRPSEPLPVTLPVQGPPQ